MQNSPSRFAENLYYFSGYDDAEISARFAIFHLPSSLTHLTLNPTFNSSVSVMGMLFVIGLLLTFKTNYKKSSTSFTKLIFLEFRGDFNQPVNNYLPTNLRHLIFGSDFDQGESF